MQIAVDVDRDVERPIHYGTAAIEAAIVFAIPTIYYWQTKEHQALDRELDGSLPNSSP